MPTPRPNSKPFSFLLFLLVFLPFSFLFFSPFSLSPTLLSFPWPSLLILWVGLLLVTLSRLIDCCFPHKVACVHKLFALPLSPSELRTRHVAVVVATWPCHKPHIFFIFLLHLPQTNLCQFCFSFHVCAFNATRLTFFCFLAHFNLT